MIIKAAIDIGTNSTRLYIAKVNGEIKRIEKHAVITRLGQSVDKDKRLGTLGIEKNVSVLLEYKSIANAYGVNDIKAIATSAVRDAVNRKEFIDTVRERTGINVKVISGEEEAELGFTGAYSVLGSGYGVVCDIGGGSTELILGVDGKIHISNSIDIGSVRMTERFLSTDRISRTEMEAAYSYIKNAIGPTINAIRKIPDFNLVGIAGTITTLAAIDQGLVTYDIDKVHGYKLKKERVDYILEMLVSSGLEDRKKIPGLQMERADIIPAGALILKTVMEELSRDQIIVSEMDNLDGIMIKDTA